jgi:hypothetical protein
MTITITDDVSTGKDARLFVSMVSVTYTNEHLRDIIFDNANDDKFLLITKKIGSKIMIHDVRIIDDDLIDSMLTDST